VVADALAAVLEIAANEVADQKEGFVFLRFEHRSGKRRNGVVEVFARQAEQSVSWSGEVGGDFQVELNRKGEKRTRLVAAGTVGVTAICYAPCADFTSATEVAGLISCVEYFH
jgi:hypothetical protein